MLPVSRKTVCKPSSSPPRSKATLPTSTPRCALLHCEKDRYIETWALMRCPGAFLDPRRAPGGHAADAGGTHLPLRGLVLHLLPSIDVARAFFRHELKAGHDGGPDAAPLLRGSADG